MTNVDHYFWMVILTIFKRRVTAINKAKINIRKSNGSVQMQYTDSNNVHSQNSKFVQNMGNSCCLINKAFIQVETVQHQVLTKILKVFFIIICGRSISYLISKSLIKIFYLVQLVDFQLRSSAELLWCPVHCTYILNSSL